MKRIIIFLLLHALPMMAQLTDPDSEAGHDSMKHRASHVLSDTCSGEGAWLPLGVDAPADAMPVEIGEELHIVYKESATGKYGISKWTGDQWQRITDFTLSQHGVVNRVIVYKGKLYIGGAFFSLNSIDGTIGIASWDGSEFSSAGGGLFNLEDPSNVAVMDMEVYNGVLVATGTFQAAGFATVGSVAYWDGVFWNAMLTDPDGLDGLRRHETDSKHTGTGYSLAVDGDLLYVGGAFWYAEEKVVSNIAVWDGLAWQALGTGVSDTVLKIIVYDHKLYVWSSPLENAGDVGLPNNVGIWNGSEWEAMEADNAPSMNTLRDWIVYQGSLYTVTGRFSDRGISRFDGSNWRAVNAFEFGESPLHLTVFRDDLIACGNFTSFCGTSLHNIARFCDDGNCSTVSGFVYEDRNSNCLKESEEQGLLNRVIHVLPENIYSVAREDGSYTVWVSPGTHTLSVVPRNYWQSCLPGGVHTIVFSEPGEHLSGRDFGLIATEGIEEVEVSIAGSRMRPGREAVYSIRYENTGTLSFTGTITMKYDPVIIYEAGTPSENRHMSQTLEWDISDLPVGATGTIRLKFTLPPDASLIGKIICVQVKAVSHSNPSVDPLHSKDEECVEVTGSYDPNMIVVSPSGIQPEGYITRKDTVLHYVIHFQNTGNDTAFKIVVMDRVPAQLDLSTLRAGASSHTYELEITKRNELKWVFNNIMLPDSNASEPNSHGFVKYEIQLKKDLPIGTEIRNAADIYFDYNAPVRTNEVKNVIAMTLPTGVEEQAESGAVLYPNPTAGYTAIVSPVLVAGEITIYNSLGEAVLSLYHAGGTQTHIHTEILPPGMYYINYSTVRGRAGKVLAIVR